MHTLADSTTDGPAWELIMLVISVLITAVGAVIGVLVKRSNDLQAQREDDRIKADEARENERRRTEAMKDKLAEERHGSLLSRLDSMNAGSLSKFNELTTGINEVKVQVRGVEERVERHQAEYREEVTRLHARDQALAVELATLKGRVDERLAGRAAPAMADGGPGRV